VNGILGNSPGKLELAEETRCLFWGRNKNASKSYLSVQDFFWCMLIGKGMIFPIHLKFKIAYID